MNYPRLAMDTMKLPNKIEGIHHLFERIDSSKKLSEYVIRIPKHEIWKAKYSIKVFK